MKQLPIGAYLGDPVPVPVQYRLTRVEDGLAVITFTGETKLSIPAISKETGASTGTLTVTGTISVDLATRLVERSEMEAVTKLHYADTGKDMEGVYSLKTRRQ